VVLKQGARDHDIRDPLLHRNDHGLPSLPLSLLSARVEKKGDPNTLPAVPTIPTFFAPSAPLRVEGTRR